MRHRKLLGRFGNEIDEAGFRKRTRSRHPYVAEIYGWKECDLIEPWRGYRRGTIVRQTPKGFVVQLSSGAEIDVYPDEMEID